jgi:hypothetical protein
MSDKRKTAVSWLIEQYEIKIGKSISSVMSDEINQAKQIEREQIEDAYGDGLNAHRTNFCNRNEYYEQTYGE